MNLQYRITNSSEFKASLAKDAERARKASITAAKVEGYRLSKEMKAEIRSGSPGGSAMSPLSVIRTGKLTGGRKPLSRLAITPRYATINQSGESKTMVGFLSTKLSKKWIQIANMHQDGFFTSADAPTRVGSTYRKMFARIGGLIKNKAVARYYFLKKETKVIKTPARLVIVPFWRQHRTEAAININANFERKMRGERI